MKNSIFLDFRRRYEAIVCRRIESSEPLILVELSLFKAKYFKTINIFDR